MTLEDLYNQDDFALENDDLRNMTILDLICPPDEENQRLEIKCFYRHFMLSVQFIIN